MRITTLRLESELHKTLRIGAIEADAINQAVALLLTEYKRKGVKK